MQWFPREILGFFSARYLSDYIENFNGISVSSFYRISLSQISTINSSHTTRKIQRSSLLLKVVKFTSYAVINSLLNFITSSSHCCQLHASTLRSILIRNLVSNIHKYFYAHLSSQNEFYMEYVAESMKAAMLQRRDKSSLFGHKMKRDIYM